MMRRLIGVLLCLSLLSACNPTVRLDLGDKPLEINLNIKHEIRVKIEKEIDALAEDDEIF
ncbi:YnbE family lipoprotein [Aliikangiella marina]|uniref:YnbE family lipoprotein n=1 Tax=Aliikangiella marina TaxID=1712262 RepID=A0A545TJ10_9GAMM|nr:YnbE family lipoprotein [Aliikangiella marina]TQV77198.1 YnbE family lipoprotein [Aliikangiella marina]